MKIKVVIIIYVKFKGAQKLMILAVFIMLYAQILSGSGGQKIKTITEIELGRLVL